MNKIITVCADKASIVINGICFSFGGSDGVYNVIFTEERPSGVQEQAWIDLRDWPTIVILESDCNPGSGRTFGTADFGNSQALSFGFDKKSGNFYFWKLF